MTGAIRMVSGEKKARKNYARAQDTYNVKLAEINNGSQYYQNMLGQLQKMQGGLSSYGRGINHNQDYLQALEREAQQHQSELANLENTEKQLATTYQRSFGLSEPLTQYEAALQESEMKPFEEKVANYNKRAKELSTLYGKKHQEIQEQIGQYDRQKEIIENFGKHIEDYKNTLQTQHNELGSLERVVTQAGGKLKQKAQLTGLATIGAGLVTGNLLGAGLKLAGAPSAVYQGAKFVPKLLGGISAYKVNGQSLKGLDTFSSGASHSGNNIGDINLAPYQMPPKVKVAELGNLPLSLEHFGMPTQPKLKQLPTINSALGRKDSEKSSQSFLSFDYLKQLKKIYKGLNLKRPFGNRSKVI